MTTYTHVLDTSDTRLISGSALKFPCSVGATPRSGDTVLVEVSYDGTNFANWTPGATAAAANQAFATPVAVFRVSRSAGTGTTSSVTFNF